MGGPIGIPLTPASWEALKPWLSILLSAEVRRLFEMSAFTDLFTICGTRDEGLAKAK